MIIFNVIVRILVLVAIDVDDSLMDLGVNEVLYAVVICEGFLH